MMRRTVVLNVVGLTRGLLGEHTPNLSRLARTGAVRTLETVLPAVTCSVQASFTTGRLPRDHGIVGNGWYFRDQAEIWLWRQSNALVNGEMIWDAARKRDPSFTVAKLFWWYNMYSSADYAATPRPIYTADGQKIPDLYTEPEQLRDVLQTALGTFPLFHFWGPRADILSSRWIAQSARHVFDTYKPTLTLVYLPHLDYNLQRLGPDDPRIHRDLQEIDQVCGELIEHVTRAGARVIALSEYGITGVTRPVAINRALREAGLLRVREELGSEKLDAGGSHAFAIADHQVAHVYVRDPSRVDEVKRLLASVDGVERVLDREQQRAHGLDHARSGELFAIAERDRWFSYYYWLDDARAPDYARTVDIHRKPGYDPAELFIDPALRFPLLRIGRRVAQKKLGFRTLMDVVPLHGDQVRGSHGRLPEREEDSPVFLSSDPELVGSRVHATDVKELVLAHVFGARERASPSTDAV